MKTALVLALLCPWLAGATSMPSHILAKIQAPGWRSQGPGPKIEFALKADNYSAPIRQAYSKVSVQKHTWMKQSDGSFAFNQEEVCTHASTIKVFADENLQIDTDQILLAECSSTYNGRTVTVAVSGLVALFHRAIFNDEGAVDFKAMYNYLYLVGSDTSDNFLTSYSGTRYTGATSTLGSLSATIASGCVNSPNSGTSGTICMPSMTEYFEAVTEIKDTP